MDRKAYITRKVKAKVNLLKKIKDLKNKVIKKKYKTLNEENAVNFVKDLGKKHYWKFDVEDKPKTKSRTYQGVKVIDVKRTKLFPGKDTEGLEFVYEFIAKYGEKSGQILINGSVFYEDEPKKLKEIEEKWKKKESFGDDVSVLIINRALETSQMQAIALAGIIALPSPVRLPKVMPKDAKQ